MRSFMEPSRKREGCWRMLSLDDRRRQASAAMVIVGAQAVVRLLVVRCAGWCRARSEGLKGSRVLVDVRSTVAWERRCV
ncbi:hypothetical protein Micbo1qcDRAFT_155669 [Microdochium bolleyi]|uniref:Uncharacterized protein n=1 Tax=Microdochium bolleyi TaxID=196109 RepID=A0A136JIG8_9PEZI|nr:hypothetical protein Micbo1qcDRAFT_155669 [Microdochium bolleyi]